MHRAPSETAPSAAVVAGQTRQAHEVKGCADMLDLMIGQQPRDIGGIEAGRASAGDVVFELPRCCSAHIRPACCRLPGWQ
jgi:hypothetical protein